jgi:RsiW-degrading membrane proteinase PrsW (M82 family)
VIIIYLFSLIIVSILPGILWVWYFYKKDIFDPEPKHLIIRDFIWGILAVFPASYLEAPFSDYLSSQTSLLTLFFSTILIVGVIEEGAKSLVVYILHYNHPDFNEALDGIIYGVTVGLGFAAFENLFYTMLYGYQVGLSRAVLTSLAHASFTGIFGYFLGQAKMNDNKSLETIKKNNEDNIRLLDDIKRRVKLLGHGYSEEELSFKKHKFNDKDAKIISLEKENEKLRKQLDEVYRRCVIVNEGV